MAGCYGSSPEDRYFEAQLYRHLDGEEDEESAPEPDWELEKED